MAFPNPLCSGALFAGLLLTGLGTATAAPSSYEQGLIAYSKQNFEVAAILFSKAAEQGQPGADHMLMRMYSEGQGVTQNHQKGYEWAKQAAENGIGQAQYILAGFLRSGTGTRQDHQRAAHWYSKAAQNGYHLAYYKLAHLYINGTGVKADVEKAQRLYVVAAGEMDVYAQKGDHNSQNELAWMFENGLGVKKNLTKAHDWYLKAALSGYAESQYNLARLLTARDVDPGDKAQAIYWLEQAARQGLKKASILLTQLWPTKAVALNQSQVKRP